MNEDFKPVSPSVVLRRLDSYAGVLVDVRRGLKGNPFTWGDGERRNYVPKAANFGCTLVTETQAKKRGFRLKPTSSPIGSAYFGAPLSRWANLFVLECHCVPIKKSEAARRKAEGKA